MGRFSAMLCVTAGSSESFFHIYCGMRVPYSADIDLSCERSKQSISASSLQYCICLRLPEERLSPDADFRRAHVPSLCNDGPALVCTEGM